ncbi:magnesium transporter CorA family protein [Patescibacteria group bacterium]|nr:magnesium transporter CorA family protein [Patescibacteria group bacterium]
MHTIVKGPRVTWVDIQNPDEEDIEYLKETYGFHPLVLEGLIPPAWRAKVDTFPNYLFFIYYYPIYNKAHKHTRSAELDVIVSRDVLITSHYASIVPLKSILDHCNLYEEKRKDYMSQTAGHLLFNVLDEMRENTFVKLDRISKKLHQIEEGIFQGNERQMLQEISMVKTDIINFWGIVNPQGEILESLRKEGIKLFGQELEPYFTRLLGDWHQAANTLQVYKEMIEGLDGTNNALLTDKTNEIVKLLTIFAVIVFPLTLFAGIFGMNTDYLPIVGIPGDFWIITGAMIAGMIIMIGYIKWRKWI